MTKGNQLQKQSVPSQPSSASFDIDVAKIESKLNLLEKKINSISTSDSSLDLSVLPTLPSRKESTVIQRVDALENKLELLISILSK
jgi:hypothetical protein